MKKMIPFVAISIFLFSCQVNKKETTFSSDKITLHGGKVWTSAEVSTDGKPQQIAIVLDDATLNSVPVGQPSDHFSHSNNLMVPIPGKSGSPFQFVMVNWNSSGHEPDS